MNSPVAGPSGSWIVALQSAIRGAAISRLVIAVVTLFARVENTIPAVGLERAIGGATIPRLVVTVITLFALVETTIPAARRGQL
jgi:hypothetical protein